MTLSTNQSEIAIAGGGLVGLTLAAALAGSDPDLSITIVDPAPSPTGQDDGRASAVAAAARRMLATLGVWPAVTDVGQPILDMIVTDSRAADVARPTFLTFDGTLEDGEPFAHMVPNSVLKAALLDRCVLDHDRRAQKDHNSSPFSQVYNQKRNENEQATTTL